MLYPALSRYGSPRVFALCVVLSFVLLPAAQAQQYKPIFSDEVLQQADPAARERMAALEQQNRERWLARQATNVSDSRAGASGTPTSSRQPPSNGSQLMRYVDANGVTHFSRNPPAGVAAVPVEVATDNPTEAEIAERRAVLASEQAALDDFAERRRVEERRTAEVEAQLVARQQQRNACRDLYNDIQDYRRGGTVYYDLDERGERVYWSEARLAQEISKLETRYTAGCGSLDDPQELERLEGR